MASSTPKLFRPVKVGNVELKHRIVMAPLTRFRADAEHVHTDMGVEYYSQRASTPGTLLITEGTFISVRAGGFDNVPALETEAQLAAWKKITDAVHEKGSFIFAQLWALGRQAEPETIAKHGFEYIGVSDIPLPGQSVTPRPLTTAEAKEFVQLYGKAAENAIRAGFDGVEIHAANGFLIDQFIQDVTNNRTDEYGGSIENRAKFALEVVDTVVKAVGAERTAIRFSPWADYGGMRMTDPIPQFAYVVRDITNNHPDLAYIHVVEPRASGIVYRDVELGESNDFIRNIWAPRPLISAGGYNHDLAFEVAEKGDLVAFGRYFISNPDLPIRILKGIPFNQYDRSTFYKKLDPKGYTDYPFAKVGETTEEDASLPSKLKSRLPTL